MDDRWEILVVDDDEDIHAVTRLALRHRRWRKRAFGFTSARSAAEAIAILSRSDPPHFDVAIVDVVMETNHAGLALCEFIRAHCPPSLRIVLRTGQPGTAPEEYVLNEFDIDYYLNKSDLDEAKLFSVIAACLRSSLDIATLLAFGKQIRSFATVLQGATTTKDLLVLMHEGLKFLALKYNARLTFTHDVAAATSPLLVGDSPSGGHPTSEAVGEPTVRAAIAHAHAAALTKVEAHRAGSSPEQLAYVVPFEAAGLDGGIYIEPSPGAHVDRLPPAFQSDLAVFIENWRITFTTLQLQEQVNRDRMLREQMYLERMQSIATMVAGVSHEINTPLGVANTASSMIDRLLGQLREGLPAGAADPEIFDELAEATSLLGRNIYRAHNLIKSFKQLSTGQLSDDRASVSIASVIEDCFQAMKPELKKADITTQLELAPGLDPSWDGFPGHLSQVVVNLIQNTIRYAYTRGGTIRVRVAAATTRDGYSIAFEDQGAGIAPEILPRIFEPFVTTGRSRGGTGLGLAISHNIVTNLLAGTIRCVSKLGEGTTFFVEIPKAVPAPVTT